MASRRGGYSPYYYFVRDQLPELRRRGLPVASVADAIPYCSEAWALLPQEKKSVYAEKARKWKQKQRPQEAVKEVRNVVHPVITCLTAKTASDTSVMDDSAVSWKNDKAVVADVFYFLDIYSHGKLPSFCEQLFLPCEIGCVRYSLQDGITADFHHFIEPEVPPRGFWYHCQSASEITHKIPLSGFHLSRTRYAVVLQKLLEFVQPARDVRRRFCCRSSDRFRISWCLNRMASVTGIESHLELLAVEDLVTELYHRKYQSEPPKTWMWRELDVSLWDFSSNTGCKWHEENGIVYCALASSKKIAYSISKSFASVYGVPLTAAHLPLQDSCYGGITYSRMGILDTGHLKKVEAEGSGCDGHFTSPSQDQELVPCNYDSPHGVKSSLMKQVPCEEEELLNC